MKHATEAFIRLNLEVPEGPVYKRPLGMGQNSKVKAEIESLDSLEDCQRIVYLLVSYEFSYEMTCVLDLAYFGSGGNKAVADILGKSSFRKNGMKRYEDTRILISKFLECGWDTNEGHRAIEQMNKIHSFYKIDDYQFALSLSVFIVAPIAWIDLFGWRKMTEKEKDAWYNYWAKIGQLMNIQGIPASINEANQMYEEYISNEEGPKSKHSPSLGEATMEVFVQKAPWYAKAFVPYYLRSLLRPRISDAFGYKDLPLVAKLPVALYLKLSALRRRFVSFYPFPNSLGIQKFITYPNGLPSVENTGPEKIVKRLKKVNA